MRLDPRIVDVVLALAVLVAVELTCWVSPGLSESDRIVTAIAAVAFAAPIAVRRRWPAEALVICATVVTVSMLFGGQLLSNDNAYVIPVLVLGYPAGAGLERRQSVIVLMLALALLWAWAVLPGPNGSPGGAGSIGWALFYATMLLVPTWLIGRFVHRYSRRTSAFDALATQAAAAKDEQQSAAITAERARIGSELQDIIAHSISAMVIQAGGARMLLRTDPGRARDSILHVEETGRQALGDLRRLLGMLRKDDDPRALSPQPGLGQLTALIDSLQDAGLACERRTIGKETDLTPGIDLVGYRVVEAALRAAAAGPRPTQPCDRPLRAARSRAGDPWRPADSAPQHDLCSTGGARRALPRRAQRRARPRRLRAACPSALRSGSAGVTVTVLIADDQALVRTGFRMILETDPEIQVAAEAGDGAQAVDACRRIRPDIVLTDIRMPVMDGLEATRRVLATEAPPRVLILTTFDLDEYVFDALVAGASGFLLKDVSPEQLLAAIRTIANGDSLLAPSVTRRLIEAYVRDHPATHEPTPGLDELTARELEILEYVAQGLSNSEIAAQLFLSPFTVKTHVGRVLDKLKLRDRVQAVVLAYEAGIVRPGSKQPHIR